jgi:DNA-binding MarR family transcriptional regulator
MNSTRLALSPAELVQERLMDVEELSKTIIEFYEKLSTWEEGVVRDSGLTTAQNHTVEIVGHEGAIKMKRLADKLGVTTGTLTVSIDRLEKKELLKRVPHQSDRRSYLIELTDKGREVFKKHHNHHLNLTQEMMTGFTEQEQAAFHDAVKKAMKNF